MINDGKLSSFSISTDNNAYNTLNTYKNACESLKELGQHKLLIKTLSTMQEQLNQLIESGKLKESDPQKNILENKINKVVQLISDHSCKDVNTIISIYDEVDIFVDLYNVIGGAKNV